MTATENKAPFGIKDKLGYLLGNVANDFTFTFASIFLLVFYTKVLGIPSAIVGTTFLVARFVDAFTDITVGRIVDRMHSGKNGKFRPWLKYAAAPVAIASFLMYQSGVAYQPMWIKITYMILTYLLWGSVCYTCINIPYGSMASVISSDSEDRAALSTWRSVGSVFANLIIGVAVPYFIYTSDEVGNQIVRSEAFVYVSAVLSALALVFYLVCYKMTTERIKAQPHSAHRSEKVTDTAKALFTDRALIGIVIASVCVLAAQLLSQAINQYLFIDYFSDRNGVMLMSVIGILPALLLAPAAVPLSKRFGKREIGVFGSVFGALSCFLLFLLRTRSVAVYISVSFFGFLGFGVYNLITWAFITDIIDASEIRTGVRRDGTVYAVYSFARKVGQAIAGGLGGWALAWIGFDEGAAVQSERVLNGIYTVSTLIPAILYTGVALSLAFVYPLSKKRVERNISILKSKRENGG